VAGRILVIRGGAIGDFLLTLPALRLLREAFPATTIELLGYRHIQSLATERYYASASRSIEYGPLASFFARGADLPTDLVDYFASFDQIISYLFDPDGIFAANLARCGHTDLLVGSPKFTDDIHVTYQLARPMEKLALFLDDPAARIFPTNEDRAAARALIPWEDGTPAITIHPGSGSLQKNWPPERWASLLGHLADRHPALHFAILSGESDQIPLRELRPHLPGERIWFVPTLPLPMVGALLQEIPRFMGHDSGISHLAAAAGADCLLLFGPTDPGLWAPLNPGVQVCRAPAGRLPDLSVETVADLAEHHFF
jgi:heptosyltransferase-3